MRFFDVSATALAAAALLQGASAQSPEAYGQSSSMTSATTTYYTTRTVMRVVETLTATRNGTTSAYTSTSSSTVVAPTTFASATGSMPSYGNGTSVVLGTGTGASASVSATGSYTPSMGAAGKVGVEALGFAAVAGLAGLLLV